MGDVANHLLTEEDLCAALRASAAALAPSGLLLFDANTITVYRTVFASHEVIEREDTVFAWIGDTPEPTPDGPATARIIAFQRDGAVWRRSEATVNERHYSPDVIRRLLEEAGLQVLATYGLHHGQFVTPAEELTHAKVVYVARKFG